MLSPLINTLKQNSAKKKKKITAKEHRVSKSLKKGLKEVELIKQGKIKATPLKDFLDY